MEEKLELRMYSLVIYQLSGRQIGIQSGHSNVEYGVVQGSGIDTPYYDWSSNWKTVIVLNGGSTITLKQSIEDLNRMGITNVPFREPDLDNIITSVSFLVDERVFNYEKYPDFVPNNFSISTDLAEYDEWEEKIGGPKNAELRTWLRKFRLA